MNAGDPLIYNVNVTNNGPSDAQAVLVTHTLPSDVAYNDSLSNAACDEASPPTAPVTVECSLGTLAFGASTGNIAIVVDVDPSATVTLDNSATVTATSTLVVTGDDTVGVSTTVNVVANLAVAVSAGAPPIMAGNALVYTVTVTNNGPSDATGVTLTNTLPAETTFVSTTETGFVSASGCTESSGVVTCDLGPISGGGTGVVTINTRVLPGTLSGTVIDNVASVVGNENDSDTGDNTSTTQVEVIAVNTTADSTGTCDASDCSLREAIDLVNADTIDYIAFDIGSGVQTLNINSSLPSITLPVTIDGTTQPGYSDTPLIVLAGSASVNNGLHIQGGNSTVKGLVIQSFSDIGILIDTNGGNVIEGNFIGTDATGTLGLGNATTGVSIVDSPDNLIGGTTANAGNLISGNDGVGVGIEGASSTNNRIEGNLIGTNFAGTSAIPNQIGVGISGSNLNIIGGSTTAHRNIISGNSSFGLFLISSDGNAIKGNFIGTDVSGSTPLGNSSVGLFVLDSNSNTIGGATLGERNVISNNGDMGIYLTSSSVSNDVKGNIIGLDHTGTQRMGNTGAGVRIDLSSNGTTIGGTQSGEGNIISDNEDSDGGIVISDSNNTTIQGNLIGTDITGTANRGNDAAGIAISGTSNGTLVGGVDADDGTADGQILASNTIAFNGGDGVIIYGTSASLVDNEILGNSIFSNGGIGINLENSLITGEATSNDPGDADTGANKFQNFPTLAVARLDVNGDLAIRYSVTSDPANSTYPLRIEFYKADANGQGWEFLGSSTSTEADFAAGLKDVTIVLAAGITIQDNDPIVATATDNGGAGSTSEFSDVILVGVTPPHVVNSTLDVPDLDVTDNVCDTGVVTSTGDAECTLRAAIEQANSLAGLDIIEFEIAVPADDSDPNFLNYDALTGVFSIKTTSPLPVISDLINIDATTQPGYAGTPLIELDGTDAGNQAVGLHITAGSSIVRGLAINRFSDDGIRLQTSGGNTIEDNFIGTDATGTAEFGNGGDGVRISSSPDNTVQGNVISGNGRHGVSVFGIEATGNVIKNNMLGADVAGIEDLGNAADGVSILDASDNTVGPDNVIAFNASRGVSINGGTGNAASGNAMFSNSSLGIDLGNDGPTSNDTGDSDAGANNLQNAPEFDRVRILTDLTVEVEYGVGSTPAGPANSAYPLQIEFYKSDGTGQGKTLVGSDTYESSDFSAGAFKTINLGSALTLNVVTGDEIVALATDADNNTSEFSAVEEVADIGQGGIFVVNTVEDAPDVNPGDGICDDGAGNCTLRAAIDEANVRAIASIPSLDRISFNVGSGTITIQPTSELPAITDPIVIDGTTQPGFVNTPIVEIDGSLAGAFAAGLTVTSGDSLVRGLVINRFGGDGLVLDEVGGNTVVGNFIGTGITGTVKQPNLGVGLRIEDSPDNVIGGVGQASRNVVSGNNSSGILITGTNSTNNVVSGNYIGVGSNGVTAISNGLGVRIEGSASNFIGGTGSGAGNVISGNSEHGVFLKDSGTTGNQVQGNFIGTDATATLNIGNGSAGIQIEGANNNSIGGTTGLSDGNGSCTGACNNIAFNGKDGIRLRTGTGNSFLSNAIFSNTELGIDLLGALDDDGSDGGVTVNDGTDVDTGPNNLQNFPVFPALTSARIDASDSFVIEYSVDSSIANSAYPLVVQFFKADADSQEGLLFIGSDEYAESDFNSATGEKTASIPNALSLDIQDGDLVVATATDNNGNTSEFSDTPIVVVEARFTVNLNTDVSDDDTSDGLCDTDPNTTGDQCTLRAAIEQANAIPGEDAIEFTLPATTSGDPLLTITVDSTKGPLPIISDPAVIDGTTQPGFTNDPIIVLNGNNNALTGIGLQVSSGSTTIRGIEIQNFESHGIQLDTLGNNLIENIFINDNGGSGIFAGSGIFIDNVSGNVIGGTSSDESNRIDLNTGNGVLISGTNATGNILHGNDIISNTLSGVSIVDGSTNVIGGTSSGMGNTIIGNVENGVSISNVDASNNLIQGNRIGVDDTGTIDLGNQQNGVIITDGPNNTVGGLAGITSGGPCSGACNIISGNLFVGVVITGSLAAGNLVQGNFIGTDIDGITALSNDGGGVVISSSASINTIGGTQSGARNVIAGNGDAIDDDGVRIEGGGANNVVHGNFIGVDATGLAALGNSGDGVAIADSPNNTIGGTSDSDANVIAGSGGDGVLISGAASTGNLVHGNFIGTNSSGSDLGNTLAGVHIVDASDNPVGGTTSGAENTIAFNNGDGVFVEEGTGTATGNEVRANSIFSNSGLGIDLGADGRTTNDTGDSDIGANGLQNFPVISLTVSPITTPLSARINAHGNLIVSYHVESNVPLDIEFFEADAGGQGQNLIRTVSYTPSSSSTIISLGSASSLGITAGDEIVATATDASNNNTSEFSDAVAVVAVGTFVVDSTGDGVDISHGDGVCSDGSGCTLRAAIQEANALAGADTIEFGISTGGVQTIQPGSALPEITEPVVIDGTTQTGFTSSPIIVLDGIGAGSGAHGLHISAGDSIVRGLAIHSFSGNGVLLEDSNFNGVITGNANGGTIVAGNYVGTDANGTSDLGNGLAGVFIDNAPNNVVGGTTTSERNIISGNEGEGVRIEGGNATDNSVIGNLIGLDAGGSSALGNTLSGVRLTNGANGNSVGGSTGVTVGDCTGDCNDIAFNGGDSVQDDSGADNTISSNSIHNNESSLGINVNTQNVADVKAARIDATDDLFITYSIASVTADTNLFPLTVEFFLADSDGEEGQVFLGGESYSDTSLGNKTVNLGSVGVTSGQVIVATTTDDNGKTTNFSASVEVTAAATFEVNSTGDAGDNDKGDTACDDGSGNCTLRAALEEANAVIGVDIIQFNIVGSTVIQPDNPLPIITDSVIIEGFTQTGIVVDGTNAGSTDGFSLLSGGSTIQGLTIQQFSGNGVFIESSNNRVGGVDADDGIADGLILAGNTITGNGGDGIRIKNGTGNSVRSNSVFNNGGIGINLLELFDDSDLETANDTDDKDDINEGPNNLQNFPEISAARLDAIGNLIIEYKVESLSTEATFPIEVEFFVADSTGKEGQTFLGRQSYDVQLLTKTVDLGIVAAAENDLIVATATDDSGDGDTSEFSTSFTVTKDPAIIVNSIGDQGDDNSSDGICDTGAGGGTPVCTLRAAIEHANDTDGVSGIEFDISGTGPHVIEVGLTTGSDLPEIVLPLIIDGTTEPDFAGTPVVEINGSSAPSNPGFPR